MYITRRGLFHRRIRESPMLNCIKDYIIMKCKIYKITNTADDEIYVGSTTKESLEDYLIIHFDNINRYNTKFYKYIKKIGKDNFNIHLIEEIEVDNHKERRRNEQKYIELLKPSLNTNRAYITEEQKKKNVKRYFMIKAYNKRRR